MSKATIKRLLQSMPKNEIIGMVLEMYDGRGKTESQIHGNADSRIYGFTEISTE
jgi:hypothetical protein